ncbi:terpene synthase family protein [Streptomyces sp. NPDC021100]|uniref:terpene synthase family protein n=1 Tax=Streptomyces sp. NPDC021100 TaxID=3365114 RepID=UPI0037B902B8
MFIFSLLEFSLDFTIPEAVRNTAAWNDVVNAGVDVILLQNDINGYQQDLVDGFPYNAVALISHQQKGTAEEAATIVNRAVAERIADFHKAEDALRTYLRSSETAGRTAELIMLVASGIKSYAQGALAWYEETGRYSGDPHNPCRIRPDQRWR